MFHLQALQTNGTWYTLGAFDSAAAAHDSKIHRGGWRRGAVQYRVVRA